MISDALLKCRSPDSTSGTQCLYTCSLLRTPLGWEHGEPYNEKTKEDREWKQGYTNNNALLNRKFAGLNCHSAAAPHFVYLTTQIKNRVQEMRISWIKPPKHSALLSHSGSANLPSRLGKWQHFEANHLGTELQQPAGETHLCASKSRANIEYGHQKRVTPAPFSLHNYFLRSHPAYTRLALPRGAPHSPCCCPPPSPSSPCPPPGTQPRHHPPLKIPLSSAAVSLPLRACFVTISPSCNEKTKLPGAARRAPGSGGGGYGGGHDRAPRPPPGPAGPPGAARGPPRPPAPGRAAPWPPPSCPPARNSRPEAPPVTMATAPAPRHSLPVA